MKQLAQNRRGRYDYSIDETITAGLVLTGPEVKSAKLGQISLKGSFITLKDGEAWLHGAYFTPYAPAAALKLNPERSRKLLLHKQQLEELKSGRESGIQPVPLSLVEQKGLVKLVVGLGRGKKRYDKRETIKRREQTREAGRELRRRSAAS